MLSGVRWIDRLYVPASKADVDTLLEVHDLAKTYADRRVLDGVSFSLEEGEAKVVMGPSAAASRRCCAASTCCTELTSGAILCPTERIPRRRRSRSRIGLAFQNFALYRHMFALDT